MATRNDIIQKAALKLDLPYEYVWEAYYAYWKFVRYYIASLPIKENLAKEEFDNLRTSVNIPSLGKFYIEWERLQNKKKRKEKIKNEGFKN